MTSNNVAAIFEDFPANWELTTLGDVCKRGGGYVQTGPFGSQLHASDYVQDGIPTIMPVNIGENQILTNGIARITEKDAERLSRHRLEPGDIVFSRRGDVTRRALIREEQKGWLCGTGSLKIHFGNGIVDPLFASLYFAHPDVKDWIIRHAVGSTMPNLNGKIMEAIPFLLPPPKEQEKIARILGALDDKIDINRRMNHTLEEMARALFKSWFVDFDPVTAKAEGRVPFGINAEIASLFPAEFEETEEGLIPKGWKIGTAGDMVTAVGGTTPSTSKNEYWSGGAIAWATPKDLARLPHPVLLETDRKITPQGLKKISSGLLPAGTLLMSSRAPVGYLAISEIPVAINQGFMAMHCNKGFPNYYVIQWLRENMDNIISHANGTTFLEITKSSFRFIPAILPPEPIVNKFSEIAGKVHAQIVTNVKESKNLAAIRDALLPQLLSGELRVKQAEKVIEKM
jgi:type I restriction enzyme, S subunit